MPQWKDVRRNIEMASISPSAKRVLFTVRGELFTVPAQHGNTRNVSGTPAVREREARWSPDGRWIAYLSDETGSYALYVRRADGSGAAWQLVPGDDGWISRLVWSPDSRWIAFADNTQRLRAVELEGGRTVTVDSTTTGPLNDFSWSPDSRWIAYVKRSPNTIDAIWLYSLGDGTRTQVTADDADHASPAFDPGGRWLYFVAARDYDRGIRGFRARIYAATLRADAPHPFPPRSDEEPAASPAGAPSSSSSSDGQAKGGKEVTPLRIDVAGLGARAVALPGIQPGSYRGLVGVEDGVVFLAGSNLQRYSVETREAKTVLERISGFDVTPDRKKVLYRAGEHWGIVELRPGQRTDAGRLDLSGLRLYVDPKVEWAQIYHDAWLIMRDWFYDPGLHGVDWDAMRERYRPLVEHVAHRTDLDFVIAELLGEMNVGHAYVNPAPEPPRPERVEVGVLGAELVADGERYRIAEIYPGENWHEEFRSPLTEPGVGVKAGDYLVAIDGTPVTTRDNPYRFLVNKADRIVRLTVSARPDGSEPRTYDVRPVKRELGLLYQRWVRRNAALVDSLSGGRIGYIHLPNTSIPGHRELWEGFRPQHDKEALILDDRYNGGGFVPEEMAFLVGRPLLNYWARRNLDLYSQPYTVHTGPKAMLVNGQSSSGGDALPYYFRKLGLGPIIGERTWGGLVGISGNPAFVDGGSISVPMFAFVDDEGNWAVEGEGVAPDIEVIDRPELIAAGREPMIEKAVEVLLRELEKPQYRKPVKPKGPVRGPKT